MIFDKEFRMIRFLNTFFRAAALASCVLYVGCASVNTAKMAGPKDGGISDEQIRDVVERVAKHQIHSLADGDYPMVVNLDQARAAKPPEGIAWNYPWGVALFGMDHVAHETGDQ